MKPRIHVITLGGTISATRVQGAHGVAPRLGGADLVSAVPEIADMAEVTTASLTRVGSPNLAFADVLAIAAEIRRQEDVGVDGIVVTQGTDTLEETSFALDVTLSVAIPVVLTGAMRNPTLPGPDGPANLAAAVAVAMDPGAARAGVLVVLNDEIHAAAHVQKAHTQNPGAFVSASGPLGWLAEGKARWLVFPVSRPHFTLSHEPPPVALLKIAMGDDGRLLGALPGLGYAGVVVEGTGGGHLPERMLDALDDVLPRMPVVMASRTRRGDVLRGTYDHPGSEMDLVRHGVIGAGWLDGLKARILLSVLLAGGGTAEDAAHGFASYLDA